MCEDGAGSPPLCGAGYEFDPAPFQLAPWALFCDLLPMPLIKRKRSGKGCTTGKGLSVFAWTLQTP